MIRLFVSDVDGTLLTKDSISRKDIASVQRAAAQGIDVCLASGRMYPELQEIVKQLNVRCHCVSQNGSFVHTSTGQMIKSASFDLLIAHQLLSIAKNGQFPYTVSCSDNQIYISQRESASELKARMFMSVNECLEIESVFGKGILPCKFSFFGELNALEDFRLKLLERFPQEINTFISDKDCLDVMPRHVSKGDGLKALLHHLNVSPEEMVCVGDSFNDLAMFNVTPHSFAMCHSDPVIQKAAYQVVSSVAEVVDWVNSFNSH
jgi:Cof subfamily protein (haloacid dehalogenase superfamily)